MHHRKTKVAAPATNITTIPQQEEGQSLPPLPSSSYSPRRLKLGGGAGGTAELQR